MTILRRHLGKGVMQIETPVLPLDIIKMLEDKIRFMLIDVSVAEIDFGQTYEQEMTDLIKIANRETGLSLQTTEDFTHKLTVEQKDACAYIHVIEEASKDPAVAMSVLRFIVNVLPCDYFLSLAVDLTFPQYEEAESGKIMIKEDGENNG